MPQISVIVPIYNVEAYLKRCVDSIIEQTFTDFELILVDDGSPDRCGEICDQYAETDRRVKVIHKENGGLSDARNAGIDIAKGIYLSFIDSDDWVEDTFLEVLYTEAEKNSADISVVNYHEEYENVRREAKQVDNRILTGIEALNYLYRPNHLAIYSCIVCNKLFKKELFDNIRFPVGKLNEDSFTIHKLLYKADRICFTGNDLYCYYQRNNSIMHETFSEKRLDEYGVFAERARFFNENKLIDLCRENDRVRKVRIKSLTVQILNSDLIKQTKRKWMKIFRDDVRNNYGRKHGTPYSLSDRLFCISPKLFYYIHQWKNKLSSE